ncbi:hypothetical protein PhCBS80983_g05584 [Powellomyces hirtus]|uniref:C2H2-type domain-containing protein n=1 Tax=Powellomyces hirtus TaxID=109895 RepID=A0A507DTP1_9FUNG|nr:hypothetical protein PhCBS80983_g05584 [Powellomyces hirtus]
MARALDSNLKQHNHHPQQQQRQQQTLFPHSPTSPHTFNTTGYPQPQDPLFFTTPQQHTNTTGNPHVYPSPYPATITDMDHHQHPFDDDTTSTDYYPTPKDLEWALQSFHSPDMMMMMDGTPMSLSSDSVYDPATSPAADFSQLGVVDDYLFNPNNFTHDAHLPPSDSLYSSLFGGDEELLPQKGDVMVVPKEEPRSPTPFVSAPAAHHNFDENLANLLALLTPTTGAPTTLPAVQSPPAAAKKEPSSSTSATTPSTPTRTRRASKVYPCPLAPCSKTFTRKYNLLTHISTHNPHRPRPFICEDCDKRFLRHHDLERHETVHSKTKAFSCPNAGCTKRFTRQDAVRRHLKNTKCRDPNETDEVVKSEGDALFV